jgi:uncharacterized protein YdeI (YjbR/CyaY-like superfamily)
MTSNGLETIELAKRSGTWTALDKIEKLELPVDLKKALKQNAGAAKHFDGFPRSVKKVFWNGFKMRKEKKQEKKELMKPYLCTKEYQGQSIYT